MILNKLEFLAMNNPFRYFIQKVLEVKRLRKLSFLAKGKNVLEIGCGNGKGTMLIKRNFFPDKITAIDLDKKMIDIARKGNNDKTITFEVGDVSKLQYQDDTFDAIFNFGVIHHIPNWERALSETYRVLKSGGQIIFEELSRDTFSTFTGKIMKFFFKHPYESMYSQQQFVEKLQQLNFKILHEKKYFPLFLIKYFVIIAVKQPKN